MSWREAVTSSIQMSGGNNKEHLIIFYKGEGLPIRMQRPEEGTTLHRMLLDAGVYGSFMPIMGHPINDPSVLIRGGIVCCIAERLEQFVLSKVPQAVEGRMVLIKDVMGTELFYNVNSTLWIVTKKQKIPEELDRRMKVITIPEDAEIWWKPEPEKKQSQ